MFDKLDTDKDGTLNIKELQGRLGRKDFMGADRDNDQTLSKDELLPSSSSDSNLPTRMVMVA